MWNWSERPVDNLLFGGNYTHKRKWMEKRFWRALLQQHIVKLIFIALFGNETQLRFPKIEFSSRVIESCCLILTDRSIDHLHNGIRSKEQHNQTFKQLGNVITLLVSGRMIYKVNGVFVVWNSFPKAKSADWSKFWGFPCPRHFHTTTGSCER